MSGAVLVVGASGGCGTTVLAGGIGLAWARSGRTGCLMELDVEHGDLAGGWDVPADRTLDDLLPVVDELGGRTLRQAAFPHASGLWILLGPARPGAHTDWAPPAPRLVAAASRLASIVADGGAGLGATARAALEAASGVLVLAPATVAGARRARRLGEHLARTDAPVTTALVVRRGPSDELRGRAVSRASGLDLAGELPWRPREAAELGAGRWPSGRRARLAPAIAALAEGLP